MTAPSHTPTIGAPDGTPRERIDRGGGLDRGDGIGRYLVLELIGAGGMGVVYSAYDPELDRKVAVKLVHSSERTSRGQLQLLAEAKALAKLAHPNVVSVFDVGTVDEQVFIAMEYCPGRTLTRWLAEARRSQAEILAVFLQASAGLSAAHAAGLVHSDFKPDNVIVDDDPQGAHAIGRVRVMDFGIARPAAGAARANAGLVGDAPTAVVQRGGTPAYMSPEQHLGLPADARSDQFSYCVALWEAVHGRRPFEAQTIAALACTVVEGRITEVPTHVAVHGWLRRALMRGLSTAPADRYPSMTALSHALARDPARRARTLSTAALAIAAAAGAWMLGATETDDAELCPPAVPRLVGIWDAGRQAQVERALLATEANFAADTWSRVEADLSAYADAWVAMRVDACRATHIRHEQSAALLDARMRCLDDRVLRLGAVIDVLASADADIAGGAIATVAALPRLERCADVDYVTAEVPAPDAPRIVAAVENARGELARVRALLDSGKPADALAAAEGVVDAVRDLEYPPIEVEAGVLLGRACFVADDSERAEATLRAAYFEGRRIGIAEPVTESAIELARTVGRDDTRLREARMWADHAAADLVRRPDAAREIELMQAESDLCSREGKHEDALALAEKVLALVEQRAEADLLEVGRAHRRVGTVLRDLGRYDEAVARQILALELVQRRLGTQHPGVALGLGALASALQGAGRVPEAITTHERAVALLEAALGPHSSALGQALGALAVAQRRGDRVAESVATHERAIAILSRHYGEEHPMMAANRNNLASSLALSGRFEEALAQFRRVAAIFGRVYGPTHRNTAAALANVAHMLTIAGEYTEAIELGRKAVRAFEAALGPDHVEVGEARVSLGHTLFRAGLHDQADHEYTVALAIYERGLRSDHALVGVALRGAAQSALARGRSVEAIRLAERALAIAEKHPIHAGELGMVHGVLARLLIGRERRTGLAHARAAHELLTNAGPLAAKHLPEIAALLRAHE